MADTPLVTVLGIITLDPREPIDAGWSRVRDLAQLGGLAPLQAARLALAATGLVGQPSSVTVELSRVIDDGGTRVEAVVRGATVEHPPLPSELVDLCFERTPPAGRPERILSITAERAPAPNRPSWTALSDAAAYSCDTRQLLAVALVAASRQAAHPGTVDIETVALRMELDDTNQGLLALHAELSDRQEELEISRAAAERASQAKAAFLANMSHEIRSPINAVVGFTSLLLETELTPEQLEYAHSVQSAGRHLLGLIDDILDLSKIESGRLQLELIPFDLYACVEDAVRILALKAAEKQLPIAALFAPGTPAVVRGDPLRLSQILVNLLANAVNFTTSGEVTVEVDHRPATAATQWLTFRVTDTGAGIPAETLGRLFSPFTQADASTTRSHGGTGLGLSICRQLAEQMGGTITVESAVDRGSTFTCTIEVRLSTADESPDDSRLLAGLQILVIHRSTLVVDALRRHLASWGANVVTAPHMDDAIEHFEAVGADLALVEGEELASHDHDAVAHGLTRRSDSGPGPPVIPITALTARRTGAHPGQASVSTPISRSYLREVVMAALGDTATGAEPPAAPSSGSSTGPRARRVLYVDDNPMMVELVERILRKDPGIELHTAPNGATALLLAADRQPDMILLDLNLTDIRGDGVLHQLRANADTGSIPVVIVSGDAAPTTIDRLAGLGAAGYLTKPFEATQLRDIIDSTLRQPTPTG